MFIQNCDCTLNKTRYMYLVQINTYGLSFKTLVGKT